MPLTAFLSAPGLKTHAAYEGSVLWPFAPEWTTGEVLLGSAYRKLLLGVAETRVDRAQIGSLPSRLPADEPWEVLLNGPGGLFSPPLGKEAGQPQLMPLVPEIARYACVLGRPRGRWDPANLLLSAIASGSEPGGADVLVSRFTEALRVDARKDDFFATFVESSLAAIAPEPMPMVLSGARYRSGAAWRYRGMAPRVPAERFVEDLDRLIDLKPYLTRRQWTVLVEALLRLGLATHVLWLCRLNACTWALAQRAVEAGLQPTSEEVEQRCWSGHDEDDPLLELGRDGNAAIKNRIQGYVQARIGLNLLLHALEDAGCGWFAPVGASETETPAEAIAALLAHVAANREAMAPVLEAATSTASLRMGANALADANPRLLNQVNGFSKNVLEFVRYTLVQLQPQEDELKSYDQAYLLYRKTRATNSPRLAQPGPAALILLVHACCRSLAGVPASLADFKAHLAEYGVRAPAGELQDGQAARDLERLGLVIDSPDAGGGRLLVDPF
jgi:hypothetical protein